VKKNRVRWIGSLNKRYKKERRSIEAGNPFMLLLFAMGILPK